MRTDGPEHIGPLEWNVAFEDGRTPWGHVLAFAFDGRSWIVVDPHLRFTEVFTQAPGAEFDAWVMEVAQTCEVWRLAGRRGASVLTPGLFCVGTVKRLLGLRSGAFSPRGLRRDLVRQGAKQVFTHGSGKSSQGRSDGEGHA